jgi:hypothetical protein
MGKSLSVWTKKIHTYLGLLNFTILVVFGIAGLTATMQGPEGRRSAKVKTITREFAPPPNSDDFQAATAAYQLLNFRMAQPLSRQMIHRDATNNVTFDVYSVNGIRTITLLEQQRLLRVEQQHNNIWAYLNDMHTVTVQTRMQQTAIRMWSWYTEFSIWSLLFMSISGIYLWLASRPGHRWAQASLAAGAAAFLALYILSR